MKRRNLRRLDSRCRGTWHTMKGGNNLHLVRFTVRCLIKDLADEVLHHILKCQIRLELFGSWSSDAALGEGVGVMHETIYNQHVNGHHQHWANDVERISEEILDPRIKIDGLKDLEHIIGIWGICVQFIFIIYTSQGVGYGIDKPAEIVNKLFGKDRSPIGHNVGPVVFKRTGHFRNRNVGP